MCVCVCVYVRMSMCVIVCMRMNGRKHIFYDLCKFQCVCWFPCQFRDYLASCSNNYLLDGTLSSVYASKPALARVWRRQPYDWKPTWMPSLSDYALFHRLVDTTHSGVLIYWTVSDHLVNKEQLRKLNFFYRVEIGSSFVFLEPKTISINFFIFLMLEGKVFGINWR